ARSTYALWMKNWPEVQKASAVIRIPEISPSHQSGLIARSRKARIIHQTPMIRNRNPSVSARPAKVSAGLAKLTIADTVNSPPNNAQAQRAGTPRGESARGWARGG